MPSQIPRWPFHPSAAGLTARSCLQTYRAMSQDPDVIELTKTIQDLKKYQDDLFRYDPDSNNDIDLEPLS